MFELNLTNIFPIFVGIFMINHLNYKVSDILPTKYIPSKMIKFNRKDFLTNSKQIIHDYLKERGSKNYIKYV